jgi:hypothetical protein
MVYYDIPSGYLHLRERIHKSIDSEAGNFKYLGML